MKINSVDRPGTKNASAGHTGPGKVMRASPPEIAVIRPLPFNDLSPREQSAISFKVVFGFII
jgi:hypothetical protein